MSGSDPNNINKKSAAIRIFLIAGEPSGDLLGGRLMAALKSQTRGNVEFLGIGGQNMEKEGLDSLFPIHDISLMGLAEIIPKILKLRQLIFSTVKAVEGFSPDVLITIDSPGFCLRVLKRLNKNNIKTKKVHYVAPSVWAWRSGRVKKFAKEFDHLLTLLPFEPSYFIPNGLPSTFIGHAVIESDIEKIDGPSFRKKYNINFKAPLICVLPGSRLGEVRRHLKPFGAAVLLLKQNFPKLNVVIPTLPILKAEVWKIVKNWDINVTLVDSQNSRFDSMAASNIALAASGTVSLELGLIRVPCVIAYRVNPITSLIARFLIKVSYFNLINILLDREVTPEFIQEKCSGRNLSAALQDLLTDKNAYQNQQDAVTKALKLLRVEKKLPSNAAAETILSLLK